MTDTDIMPFGKYKGTKMANVPASYLIWLRDNASGGCTWNYPGVFEYIKENENVLESEIKVD